MIVRGSSFRITRNLTKYLVVKFVEDEVTGLIMCVFMEKGGVSF